jgi:exodeoxyribonuclease VII large subunit
MEKSAGAVVELEKGKLEYRIPNLLDSILRRFLENRTNSLAQAKLKLERLATSLTADEAVRLAHLEEKMRILDPMNVLKRGFSITTIRGKALTSTDEVEIGDEIETRLANGKLISEVKSKRNGR